MSKKPVTNVFQARRRVALDEIKAFQKRERAKRRAVRKILHEDGIRDVLFDMMNACDREGRSFKKELSRAQKLYDQARNP